jgi:hypothetical protein
MVRAAALDAVGTGVGDGLIGGVGAGVTTGEGVAVTSAVAVGMEVGVPAAAGVAIWLAAEEHATSSPASARAINIAVAFSLDFAPADAPSVRED